MTALGIHHARLLRSALAMGLGALWLLSATGSEAMQFEVDRFDDTAAATACTAVPNDCSLRGAVIAANMALTDDDIQLPAGTYVLTVAGADEDSAATGDLDIMTGTGDLEINGEDAATTIIDGNGTDRMLDVHSGTRDVLISNVTFQNGSLASESGGAIRNRTHVALTTVVVRNSSAPVGCGGGISSESSLEVIESAITGNTASSGGGLCATEALLIVDTSIAENTALDSFGGGLFVIGGSGDIESSTIANNHLVGLSGGGGGLAIAELAGSGLDVRNTTISGNTSAGFGGGVLVFSFMGFPSSPLTGRNVTLTLNVADSDNDGTGDGGGIARYDTGLGVSPPVEVSNSIAGGNVDMGGEAPDCSTNAGATDQPIIARGYNLIGNVAGCTFDPSSDLTGSIVAPPDLGPLAFNGGNLRTHRPNPTSPVINAGNPALPNSGPYTCESPDQRGVGRPQGSACDIGAVEVKSPPVCGDGFVDGAEACDGGACCAPGCGSILAGAACDDDGNACTYDQCDAIGECSHPSKEAGAACGESACAKFVCDGAGSCPTVEAPRTDCFLPVVARKSSLLLKDKDGEERDSFAFKWRKGEAAGPGVFGDPTLVGENSTMCVFDENGLVMEAPVLGGGACVSSPCWSAKTDSAGFESFKFNDKTKTGLPKGIRKVQFKDKLGPAKSKLTVQGKGTHLDFLPPPWTGAVTAQFVSPSGECWQASFNTSTRNEAGQFKAKAD